MAAGVYGEYVKQIRISRGLSQGSLAKALGLSSQYVSEVERGGRRPFNDEISDRLFDILKLSEGERTVYWELTEKANNRTPLPADIKVFIEENPYIIGELYKAMEWGYSIKAMSQ